MSNQTCKKCGEIYRKVTVQPILMYCARCDRVYEAMPVDSGYFLDMLKKALANRRGIADKGFYEAIQAMINALQGNSTLLKRLAGEKE